MSIMESPASDRYDQGRYLTVPWRADLELGTCGDPAWRKVFGWQVMSIVSERTRYSDALRIAISKVTLERPRDFSRDQRGLRGSRRGESARKVRNDVPRGNRFTKMSEESSYSSIREVGQGRAITSTSRFLCNHDQTKGGGVPSWMRNSYMYMPEHHWRE